MKTDLIDKVKLEKDIINMIKTCYDPEIPVNIYALGLIYEIKIDENAHALIKMTLTSPACPVAETLPLKVQEKVLSVEGVSDATIQLVWEPPWDKEMMNEEARLTLDMF